MADYGAENRFSIAVSVASGDSASSAIELRGAKPVGVLVPVTTTNTAIIQWWAGFDGSTPVVMKDNGGTEVESTIVATTACYIGLGNTDDAGGDMFRGVNTVQIKLFQADGSTAQAQGAARTFTLICEKVNGAL